MTFPPPEANKQIKCPLCGREHDDQDYCDCQNEPVERKFELNFYGKLDCSETDLPEVKLMLNGIANEIKSKFNRGAFVSRKSDCAVINEAETDIHSPEPDERDPAWDTSENE